MFDKKQSATQSQVGGDHALLIQAGRDVNLVVRKSDPKIKLVKISIDGDESSGCLKQKLNVVLKNNGDTTAVLLSGHLRVEQKVKITDCNYQNARFKLIQSDWTYDVDIEDANPTFAGRHSIAPNEVVSFDVAVARKSGGYETTVYRTNLILKFDEGEDLETDYFYLSISGPTVIAGAYIPSGPSASEWGLCMADNIRRLDQIGFDFRPVIDKKSVKHVIEVAPELFPNLDGN